MSETYTIFADLYTYLIHSLIIALSWFRGHTEVSGEVNEMTTEYQKEKQEEHVTILGLLTSKSLRRPLVISIVMQFSQQLSGINAVSLNYNV